MAILLVNGKEIQFDPYTNHVNDHFSNLMRQAFNAIHLEKNGVSWNEYVQMSKDASYHNISYSDVKEEKYAVEEDVNSQFKERGIDTLKSFSNRISGSDAFIQWDEMENLMKRKYEVPEKPTDKLTDIPPEPSLEDSDYQPRLGILDYIFTSRKEKKRKEMRDKFKEDHKEWENRVERIKKKNNELIEEWRNKKKRIEKQREEALQKIENSKEEYENGDEFTVESLVFAKLINSDYPKHISFDRIKSLFKNKHRVSYNSKTKNLVVKYKLPAKREIPTRKGIKYVKSRDIFKSIDANDREIEDIYQNLPYETALKVINHIFQFDRTGGKQIDSIVFNGYRTFTDKATGRQKCTCVATVQASRSDIQDMKLSEVNARAAFDHLGGSGVTDPMNDSSVTPIMRIDDSKADQESSEISDSSQKVENIAEMDWEDFEHLIGELFEKEFSKEGGEVTVTQASQDGGIDAIAHDPDPLRGGKIVIQAKRYTDTVGVSTVRDLYGTVTSERASRGVIVTTSDFSPSAYDFAQDKPIQLLSGDDLLTLLDKHGYDARIDLEEARRSD